MKLSNASRRQQRGLGLIEVCICLVIFGILLAAALPALQQWLLRQRVQTAAEAMMVDLQQARSEAVMRASSVQLRFSRHSLGTCYVLHTGASGACRCSDEGQPVCTAAAQLLRVNWIPNSRKVSVQANVSNLSFHARQGVVTSTGSIDIAGENGQTIRQIISIAGRVRACSPNGSFKNMAKCTS